MSIKDNIKDSLSSKINHRKEIACQRQNQGQIVLDKPLFDLKTASSHKSLIYIISLIALKVFEGLAPRQLFPFWKQLERSGTFIQIENY